MSNERGKLVDAVMVRLDEATSTRLEAYSRRVETRAGVRLARAEIARKLILRALDVVETEERDDDNRAG